MPGARNSCCLTLRKAAQAEASGQAGAPEGTDCSDGPDLSGKNTGFVPKDKCLHLGLSSEIVKIIGGARRNKVYLGKLCHLIP